MNFKQHCNSHHQHHCDGRIHVVTCAQPHVAEPALSMYHCAETCYVYLLAQHRENVSIFNILIHNCNVIKLVIVIYIYIKFIHLPVSLIVQYIFTLLLICYKLINIKFIHFNVISYIFIVINIL